MNGTVGPATDAGQGAPANGAGRGGQGSLAAPRALILADALVEAPGADLGADDLAHLRDDLARELHAVVGDLPAGERLQMDAYKMRVARRHPERCMDAGDTFTPTPRHCRRAVGTAAVRLCVRGLAPGPAAAVADVLAAGVADVEDVPGADATRPQWWAGWYAGLPRGAQAVVRAEAVAWATQLLTALDWGRFPRLPVIGGRDDWWQCPGGRQLVLQGRADVRVPSGRRLALLAMQTGRCPPDWRMELGYPGLVAALVRDATAAPCRVVGVWPDSGQVRVLPLDLGALRHVATAVVSAVATWVDSRIEVRHLAEVRSSA